MTVAKEHLPGYQQRDYDIVDYQMFSLAGTNLWFRGPQPQYLEPGQYFTCLGAAQTFGCFCDHPFPTLLQAQLGMPALNLGYGGAGPYFFLKHPQVLEYINNSKFVVVQVMSGRSESNSLFDSGGLEYLTRRSDGLRIGAQAAYTALLEGEGWWQQLPIGQRYFRWINRNLRKGTVKRVVAETRHNWVAHYHALLSQITVPKVLLWFSTREPNYQEKYNHVCFLFNQFPQLVNDWMMQSIKEDCDTYVECVTQRGMPQPLHSRFTGNLVTIDPACDRKDLGGKLWTHNSYYPTPEMHQDSASALAPICQQYLS